MILQASNWSGDILEATDSRAWIRRSMVFCTSFKLFDKLPRLQSFPCSSNRVSMFDSLANHFKVDC